MLRCESSGSSNSTPRSPPFHSPKQSSLVLSTNRFLKKRPKTGPSPRHAEGPSFSEEAVTAECPAGTGTRLPLPPTRLPPRGGPDVDQGLMTRSTPRPQHRNSSPEPPGLSARSPHPRPLTGTKVGPKWRPASCVPPKADTLGLWRRQQRTSAPGSRSGAP